jgi:methenyltetrahydromethanopterin cyclohydrolase
VADRAGVAPSGVFLPTYATGSMAGSVSAAARAPELALFRLFELGYDPTDVVSAAGSAPVAPVSHDEGVAMGRTNDALAYGGQVYVQVREDFDRFDEVPSTAAAEYDTPFEQVFEDADWDFYEVPESVFAPAQVTVDVVDGPTYALGETNHDLLAESFGL